MLTRKSGLTTFRLTEDEKELLFAEAERLNISASSLIRALIRQLKGGKAVLIEEHIELYEDIYPPA